MMKLVLAGWLAVFMAWTALHILIVPRIAEYREVLQQQASRALGLRVEVGHISAQGGWLLPWFELLEIKLFDQQGREALRLPRVLAAVSPLSVLQGRFEQLSVEKPELEIRRDADGHLWVAGLDTQAQGDGSAADWFFSQPEFLVRDGMVHWRDESRSQTEQKRSPVLTLRSLNVSVRNQWFVHELSATFAPPQEFGQALSLQGKFTQPIWQRAGNLQQWSGELYADLPFVNVASLRQWVAMSPEMSVNQGRGALRFWADIHKGQLVGTTADLALDAVNVGLGEKLKPLDLRRIHGRIGFQSTANDIEISSQDLVFDTQEGERWPGGVLRVRWSEQDRANGALQADRLDLDALYQISQRLPLPEKIRTLLARLQPKGEVNQLKATWNKTADELHYTAHGQVRQLAVHRDTAPDSPLASLPGLEGAQLDFDFNQKGGKARVRMTNGSLTLPMGLDDPHLKLHEASAQLAWQFKGDALAVQFNQGRLLNDDVTAEFSGQWQTGEGEHRWPGVLDLTANLGKSQIRQVHRYLPNGLSADVRSYLKTALRDGEANKTTLRLRGDLRHMPFENPKQGEFRVVTQLSDAEFAYMPPPSVKPKGPPIPIWPALTELNGELVLDRSALHFKGRTRLASAPGLHWQKLEVNVPNLASPVVSLSAEAKGSLQQVFDTVSKTALNDLTGGALVDAQAKGDASYKLALTLPIDHLDESKVQGSVILSGNALQVIPGTPVLDRAKGTVKFTEQGFSLETIQADVLGGSAFLSGGLSFAPHQERSALQLNIQGELTAKGLRQARELGLVSKLAERATGGASYKATVGVRRGQPELHISSDLKGMALGLPAPLNKSATAVLPLLIETRLSRDSLLPKSRVFQDEIKVTLGRVVSALYVRDLSGSRPRVVRGGVSVGPAAFDAMPMRDSAVGLNLQLPVVDLDAWGGVVTQITGASLVRSQVAAKSVVGQEASAENAQDYMPTFAAIQAAQVKVSDRLIHQVVVGATRQDDTWRLNVSAQELNGSAEVRPPKGNVPAQLFIRLAHLNIPPSSVSDVERMLSDQPSSIPTLDMVVNELTVRNKKLGRLEIDAANRQAANLSREWRLNKLNLVTPEATFNASGSWATQGPRNRRTTLNFVLSIRDSGALLARLGTPDAIRGGEGRVEGEVSWQGSPITLDYASMAGRMNLAIEKGQFLKTEPGAARLLGVLNLQTLPRRLTLDFRDVFSDGFAFDFVRGDIRIERGIAATNNLQMKGVVAGALIEGNADIVRETQDLKVVVVPDINAGTASLYMATINPLVGLTSYLAQSILAKPLIRAGTSEFHIDGTWAEPRVTKVD